MIAISLAEMRTITAKLCRKCRIIIQEKRDIPGRCDGHKDFRCTRDGVFSGVLKAQLKASDIAGIECSGQGIPKGEGIKPLRRDEIESAGSIRHDERQSLG